MNGDLVLIRLLVWILHFFSPRWAGALYVFDTASCWETCVCVCSDIREHAVFFREGKDGEGKRPVADERDTRMLKKIENKRTCIGVHKKCCSGTMFVAGGMQRATFDITVALRTDWTREVKISLAHASLIIDLPGCDPGAWRPNGSRWWWWRLQWLCRSEGKGVWRVRLPPPCLLGFRAGMNLLVDWTREDAALCVVVWAVREARLTVV
jgi:hypothetical protein